MLDSTMFFFRKNLRETRRRFSFFLVAAFAVSAFFGTLAHASIGEDFVSVSQYDQGAVPIDAHEQDHGHSHDLDGPDDGGQQHSHGHNPIDHSHEVPGIAVFPLGALGIDTSGAYLAVSEQHHGSASYSIDRPPRR